MTQEQRQQARDDAINGRYIIGRIVNAAGIAQIEAISWNPNTLTLQGSTITNQINAIAKWRTRQAAHAYRKHNHLDNLAVINIDRLAP